MSTSLVTRYRDVTRLRDRAGSTPTRRGNARARAVALAVAAAAITVAWSSGASATVAVRLQSRSSGRSITMPTTGTERVSRSLCAEPERFTFSLSGLTVGQTLSVWRGTSCNTTMSRRDTAQCAKVDDATDITTSAQELVLTADQLFDCSATDAGTKSIWFLVAESEDPDQDVGDAASLELGYDFSAPPGVTSSVDATPAETSVEVSWTAPDSTDIDGYVLLGEDLGEGTSDCSATTLEAGATLTDDEIDAVDESNTLGKTSESGSLGGLTVNHTYAVAVVTRDETGNYGPVSDVTCVTTEPVTDFWEAYRNAGGNAATCSALAGLSRGRPRLSEPAIALGALGVLLLSRRALRRRRPR